jgi:superfamily II DNA helicase RecQ
MDDCSCIYSFFKKYLKNDILEPPDAPAMSKFRLVDMFHRHTDSSVKSNIVSAFMSTAPLSIIICTMAFGMGIDCVGERQVIHFGPTDDTESYIQQTGRCGRDGYNCQATLLIKSKHPRTLKYNMKAYISNTSKCKRHVLFHEMEGYKNLLFNRKCSCCDICCKSCLCLDCSV